MSNEVGMIEHSKRFDAQTIYTGDCIVWAGYTLRGGYGMFGFNHRRMLAHRFSYIRAFGEIPTGLQLDHLCKNRSCVNPGHLEAVTCRENLLRGNTLQAANAKKTHCSHGHKFDDENTYRDKNNRRYCKTCNRVRALAWWRKQEGKES